MTVLPHDPRARSRCSRWALASVLILLTGTVIQQQPTSALGSVIGVSIDEAPLPVTRIGAGVLSTTVSGRGEAVVFHDVNRSATGAAQLDVAGPDPSAPGFGISVSADGCAIVRAQASGSTNPIDAIAFRYINRCTGADYDLAYTNSDYDREAAVALSYDGRFAVVQIEPVIIIGFTNGAAVARSTRSDPSIAAATAAADGGSPAVLLQQTPPVLRPSERTIFRIDTSTLEVVGMPPFDPQSFILPDASFGMDISDDGGIVVAPAGIFTGSLARPLDAVVWDVAAGVSTPVSNPNGSPGTAIYPSLSADGRFVSFASTRPIVGGEVGAGPWIYVHDRATGGYVRVSVANDAAYYSSLSGDGSQIAFGVGTARLPVHHGHPG